MRNLVFNILLLIIACNFSIKAQGILPDPPDIKYVSVIDSIGNVLIEWNPNLSTNVDGYIIFYVHPELNSRFEIDTITSKTDSLAIITSYSAGNESIKYTITSYFTENDTLKNGVSKAFHKTIFAQAQFDTCNLSAIITWNKYIGWEDDLMYDIYINNKYLISTPDTFFIHDDVGIDTTLQYVIKSTSNKGYITQSNIVDFGTYLQTVPQYVYAYGAEPVEENNYSLRFDIEQPNNIHTYILQENKNGNWINIDTSGNAATINFTANTESPNTEYRTIGIDVCNQIKVESNIASMLNLNASINNSQVTLQWNNYEHWLGGVDEYVIYRNINGGFEEIGSTFNNSYVDDLNENIDDLIGINIYYYIAAKEQLNELNLTASLKSNTEQILVTIDIHVPQAFTPNGDGKNDIFLPKTDFYPISYHMSIFTTKQFKVYETNTYTGWDGTGLNGKKLSEGSYLYYVEITTPNGKKINKYGQVFIAYP